MHRPPTSGCMSPVTPLREDVHWVGESTDIGHRIRRAELHRTTSGL